MYGRRRPTHTWPPNGAGSTGCPATLALLRRPGGDRVMAQVPAAGLDAVLVAVDLVLESGAVSAEHV